MLLTNNHFTPIVGIDIHFNTLPPFNPIHPFIAIVIDPMDYLPIVGSTVNVNGVPRGVSDTSGYLVFWKHFPILNGPFAMMPMIAHESVNFFGSKDAYIEGRRISPKGYMKMSCNDIGIPASLQLGPPRKPGKKFSIIPSLFAPTSLSIPIPTGPPVMIAPPYVPDLAGILINMAAGLGFSAAFKFFGKLGKKLLTKFNKSIGNGGLSRMLCKMGFEPINLITGEMIYEGEDFFISGTLPIAWNRSYSSSSEFEGILGKGVHCNYDLPLIIAEQENIIAFTHPEGRGMAIPMMEINEEYYDRSEKITVKRLINQFEIYHHQTKLIYHYQPFGFDNDGNSIYRVVEIGTLEGFTNKLTYNHLGQLKEIEDGEGRYVNLELDDLGRATKISASHQGVTRTLICYEYNEEGFMSAIIDAKGQATKMEYQNGRMSKKTDRNGQAFYWEYDSEGRCLHTWGDDGILEGWIEYKKGHNLVTNSKGHTSVYYYDENNLCTEIKDPEGNSQFFEYTEFFEPYREINEEGELTGYTYDSRGNQTGIVRADGTESKLIYDEKDQLIIANDFEGNTTIWNYNELGQVKSVLPPNKAATILEYNELNLLGLIKDEKGNKTVLEYDKDHNLTTINLSDGSKAAYNYDIWGKNIQSINPEGKSQTFAYDALDRVKQVRQTDNNVINLKYNAYDEVIEAKDAHRKVKFKYTPLGSLKMREENGSRVHFSYNKDEELIAIRNEHNEFYKFGRNKRGDIIRESGFDGLTRLYDRDRAGKVIKVNRPDDRWTEYEYNANGKITRAEHYDKTWETFSYNKNGQLIEAVNQLSHVEFVRNEMGQIVEEIQDGYQIKSQYNKLGQRINLSSSLGANLLMEYDEVGNLSTMQAKHKENQKAWWAQLKHNSLGQEVERVLPGGITSSWKYDSSGMPHEHIINSRQKKTRHRTYNWDVNDRLKSIVNGLTRGKTEFGHDQFGNLAWAQYQDGQFDYKLPDEVGNLYKTKNRSERKYGPGGQLLECKKYKYIYDAEGNLTEKTDKKSLKNWTYNWYGNGMLQQVIRPDKLEATFEHDALGRRTAKIVKTASYYQQDKITRFVWDGNVPLHEWKYDIEERPKSIVNELGVLEQDKPGPLPYDELITWVFDEGTFRPSAKLVGGNCYSIVCDYLGTPVGAYDEAGEQVWACELDVYGKVRKLVGDGSFVPFRYQGQYEDEETGLYYNRFRYYYAERGGYVSQDPIGLAGNNPNFYAYTKDSNSRVDPFGLSDGFYRGTKGDASPDFTPKPNEYKIDKSTGLVKNTHGVSVFDNTNSVSKKGFTPNKVDMSTVSDKLQIKQRGTDLKHFEIMPKNNMPLDEYKVELSKVKCH